MHPGMSKVVRYKTTDGLDLLDIHFTEDDDTTMLLMYCASPTPIYTKYSKKHQKITGLQVYNWHNGGSHLNALMDTEVNQFTLFSGSTCPTQFDPEFCGIQLALNDSGLQAIRFNDASHTLYINENELDDMIHNFQSIQLL